MFQSVLDITVDEICLSTEGTLIKGNPDTVIKSITTNSKKAKEGSLFIPLKGEKADGHNYIKDAVKNGASAVITMEDDIDTNCDNIVKVKNTNTALLNIASYYKSKFNIKTVAITGSVGKTTTKEFCANVLAQKYNIIRTEKNYNNHIGMPFTLFKLNNSIQCAVTEMGMSNFGEIDVLSKTAKPDIAIITNIGTCHIEFLKSKEGILKAKSEIFNGMQHDKIAILNGDDEYLWSLKGKIKQKQIYFGINNKNASVIANNITHKDDAIEFYINSKKFTIPIAGVHNVYNALAAYCVAKEMGLSDDDIQKGYMAYESDGIRQSVIKKRGVTIINDCYNASPVSVKCALDVLKDYPGKRKIAVLGDMKELGENSSNYHFEVGEYVKKCNIDCLFTLGELSKYTMEGAKSKKNANIDTMHFDNTEDISKYLIKFIKSDDVILIKGSHSMHMEKISELL